MGKTGFWKTDWFAGVILSLVLLLTSGTDLLQSLERKAYDIGIGLSQRQPSPQVAVIAIDDPSIANLGRWPWPRDIQAKMVDLLSAAQAKAIGLTVLYSEPEVDRGLAYINRLMALQEAAPHPNGEFGSTLQEAEQTLNTDRKLAESLSRSGRVLMAMQFRLGEPAGNPDRPLPGWVASRAATQVADPGGAIANGLLPPPATSILYPLEALGQQAAGLGHVNAIPDVDGAVRSEPLLVRYYNQYFPSLSLMLAAKAANLDTQDLRVRLGEEVALGQIKVATDPYSQMYTYYYRGSEGRPAFQVDSFYDVYTGKIAPEKYRDKIVLVGATATGIGTHMVTPVSPAMAPVLTLAHAVSSILKGDFVTAPAWAVWAEKAAFLLVALYIILLLPRLQAGAGAALTAALLIAVLAAQFSLLATQLMWLQLMVPATLLVVGHLVLTTKRFLVTERGKLKSDADSAESNRMLGLAFQGQGQLDMAFDKFRKCPVDDTLLDSLYNLALDFERKRQFNKAEAVFRYMADHNPKFRDLEQRLSRAKAMAETVILGGSNPRSNASILTPESGAVEKPMLGRYQVEKELGKGAMGVVYLGKDPKIGRVVAIKTMALSQEFEADELEEAKSRFFREAETAGRLNHPNIVTIFDAGEEHDLAYIAMEFLKGHDLAPHTKPGQLLSLPVVLSIVARVADALDYAHGLNVVHRDIKPANIMYEAAGDAVKVTDFGIARITDSSKTKTGMVLGTPSYMSPEQLSGKKVGGSSDLFSLGVTLYQLICGQLPFQGDSMAQLMFKIANEPHPDIRQLHPDTPPCVAQIIDKALAKDPGQRYQTGGELAQALRHCAATLPPQGQG